MLHSCHIHSFYNQVYTHLRYFCISSNFVLQRAPPLCIRGVLPAIFKDTCQELKIKSASEICTVHGASRCCHRERDASIREFYVWMSCSSCTWETIALMSPRRATAGLTLFPISSGQRSTCTQSTTFAARVEHSVRVHQSCNTQHTVGFSAAIVRKHDFWKVSKAALVVHRSTQHFTRSFTHLDDFDIRVKSRRQAEMQNPVEPGSEQKHDIGLEKSSWWHK